MYNKHTLTKRDVREVLEVLSQLENENLLAEGRFTDWVKNKLSPKIADLTGAAKTNFLKGLQTIKNKIGKPSEVLGDYIELVKLYGGNQEELIRDAKSLLSKGISEATDQSTNKRGLAGLEKFLKKFKLNVILPIVFLAQMVAQNISIVKPAFTDAENTKIERYMDYGTPTNDPDGFDTTNDPSVGGGGSGDSGGDDGGAQPDSPLVKALKAKNVDLDDSDGSLNNDDDESTVGTSLKTGEYKLDAKTFNNLEDQAVKAILDDIDNQLKDLKAKGQGPGEITIDIDPDGHISLNNAKDANRADGGLSNRANDGSDLLKNRGNEAKMLADLVKQKVEDAVKKLYPKTKITIKVNEPTKDNLSQQKVGKKGSAEQAVTVKSKVKVDGSSTIKFIQFLNKFSPNRIGGEPEGEPTGEKPREKTAAEQPRTGDAVVGTDRILAQARGSNRLGQYGAIFKVLSNDKSDIFQALGKKPGETITDRELETLRNKKEGEASTLAQVILNSRKNPNTFLKKFAAAMGGKINVEKRQRAYMAGAGEKGRSASGLNQGTVTELLREEFENMLTEAGVDQFLADASSLPKEVKLKVLALLADMYIQDNPEETISLVDPKDFGFTAQEITDAGFAFEPTSKRYIKLARGEKKPAKGGAQQSTTRDKTQSSVVTSPDVERVKNAIDDRGQIVQYFGTINTPDELGQLLIGLFQRFEGGKFTPQEVSTALSNSRSNLSEAEAQQAPDVKRLLDLIDKDTRIKGMLSNISDVKEASQTVLRVALAFVSPKFTNGNIQTAIKYAQDFFAKNPKAKTVGQSQPTTSTKAGYTSTSTAPGINIDNIKYVQEAKRWQKLAGII